MQTIGLIGGMSWYSTLTYYRTIQEETQRRCGGHVSAPMAVQSLDFARVRELQLAEDWSGAASLLADAGRRASAGGADFVLICTNLMHKVAPEVASAIDVPLIHIADAVGAAARAAGITRLGVLGARWVTEETFYSERLATHGIDVVVPDAADRGIVDAVIFDELTQGVVLDASRARFVRIIADLAARGAQAVVLACTEIEQLVGAADTAVPLIDSMRTHALHAVDLALAPIVPLHPEKFRRSGAKLTVGAAAS